MHHKSNDSEIWRLIPDATLPLDSAVDESMTRAAEEPILIGVITIKKKMDREENEL